ncbi:MAG: hypothetical protein LKG21_04680 [Ruminococcus sp.]|jgi:hypothetical protein|nr:hypothetical protein [Ruminococcus sp.]
MSENDKKDNGKNSKQKSLFQTAREMEEQSASEMQQKIAEREKNERIAYEKKLREEKIELIKMKQGEIEDSDIICETKEIQKKMSLPKKISNFFYHSKWWLWIAVFLVFLGGILIHDIVTKEHPDVVVLYLDDNDEVGNSEALKNYFESLCGDYNGNGKVEVSVYYIPYTGNEQTDYANGASTKMMAEMGSAEAMIIVAGDKAAEEISPDYALADLTKLYPNNPNVNGYKFNFKNTDFDEKIGFKGKLDPTLYIGIRKPQKVEWADADKMQKSYNVSKKLFDNVVDDLTN